MIAALSLWSCTTAGSDVQGGVQTMDTAANLTETATATAQGDEIAAADAVAFLRLFRLCGDAAIGFTVCGRNAVEMVQTQEIHGLPL